MTITIGYSGTSSPSAHRIAELLKDVELIRNPSGPVDINWGAGRIQASLNADTSTATNKRVMRELFRKNGVPMPTLYELDDIQMPAIGRPDKHTRGKGFWKCETQEDVKVALRGRGRKAAATHFMEFISKDRAPREYRAHIFKGKCIRISEKDYPKDGGHYVTVGVGDRPVKHIREAARAAIAAVGLDFGAVDVLANDNECWVLETNSAPGLGGTMPQVYASYFTAWKNGEL